ncbi:uncharacterized protein [Physcomitrium patens]|uniref:Bifunctional inhibitor/plant lipid transfer protein/seed storage helical domain-containing protein n=1 Tax=Physcomitrium patens TaxID=3218 RepID=A0A2K1IYX6_PHYPA|nr:non-specific lipid-transfer protein 2B-like [Physcomitrium patens]PNR34477.1 hypothetical protein PHYPA_024294 [Physcomitrium patens]|eukprot:XP_024356589.1 non-specific lipid-transfer protein 2B-like [Physcomitrella patens]
MAMKMNVVLLLVVLVGLSAVVNVESQAQCGGRNLSILAPCLPAAKANVQPSAACCRALSSFATNTGEDCLCAAASSQQQSGAKVEFAKYIPQKCQLTYKAGIVCNGVVIPGGQ